MPGLVHHLGRKEDRLLVIRRRIQHRRKGAGHGLLAHQEHGVVPQRRLTLAVGQAVLPVLLVDAEIDTGGAPIVLFPQPVETVVGDDFGLLVVDRFGHGPSFLWESVWSIFLGLNLTV